VNDRPWVLLVDDNAELGRSLAEGLGDRGYRATWTSSSKEAARRLEQGERVDVLITDLRMPELDGLELLALSRRLAVERPVIVMTAYGAVESAVDSIRRGAYHYLTKPFKLDELELFLSRALDESRLRREATELRRALADRFSGHLTGSSAATRGLRDFVARVANAPAPVLLLGETGTGKSLAARAIHAHSDRAAKPFITVNCAAIPDALLESELFGHVRGAFTGATSDRSGLFVDAHGGTLFLDEVGEMSPGLQAKLLDVLERGVVRPVGASRERAVDVRVIAATHQDLGKGVGAGRFREDLFYRLDVLSLTLAPLRERREDIPELIEHFLRAAQAKYPVSPVKQLSDEARGLLASYHWPGNVRELAHMLERAVLLGTGAVLEAADLPPSVKGAAPAEETIFSGEIMPIRELQRRYAVWAVTQTGGHRGRAAEKLGIDAKTLWSWLNQVEARDPKADRGR